MHSNLLSRLTSIGVNVVLVEDALDISGAENILTKELLIEIKENKTHLIDALKTDINYWLEQIKLSTYKEEIFSLLERLRPLQWSDEQRAEVSKTYIARLHHLKNDCTTGNQQEGFDQ